MQQIAIGTYATAREVLALDEPYSDDDLHAAADNYEQMYSTPLIRPGEADSEGRPNEAFARRLKTFEFRAVSSAPSGDPNTAKRLLKKLLDSAKATGFAKTTQRTRNMIHELQTELKLSLTDFARVTRTAKQIADEAAAAFKEIQKGAPSVKDRIEAVNKLTDAATLDLFLDSDKSEDVREAAMARIESLKIERATELL